MYVKKKGKKEKKVNLKSTNRIATRMQKRYHKNQ